MPVTVKIFESWETIASDSIAIESEKQKVSQAKYIRFDTLILENYNCQYQTTFTMESLILAQDER
jgi:hypothetical protein